MVVAAVSQSEDPIAALHVAGRPSNAMEQAVSIGRMEQSRLRLALVERNRPRNGPAGRRRRRR